MASDNENSRKRKLPAAFHLLLTAGSSSPAASTRFRQTVREALTIYRSFPKRDWDRWEKCVYMSLWRRKDLKLDLCLTKPSCYWGLFFGSEAPTWSLLAQLHVGEGTPPVPASAALRQARGSPTRSCGSEQPPVTSEQTPAAALSRFMEYNAER
jgi:hypothetical protein